jgi:hypothetical protein
MKEIIPPTGGGANRERDDFFHGRPLRKKRAL